MIHFSFGIFLIDPVGLGLSGCSNAAGGGADESVVAALASSL